MDASRAARTPVSMLVLDVDRLKTLNDGHGHLAGAEAIRTVGHIIAASVPPTAVGCRYGGDEFVVVLPDCPEWEARGIADDLCRTVNAAAPVLAGIPFPGATLSISVGLACHTFAPSMSDPAARHDESGEALFRQGDLVFAFGSPEGLRNSVTMGVVSAVARQPDADHPMVYIQTDAPINHGNSGGPLVNANGELVGINTFILSESGGSEGLGFAIPSAIVSVACEQLRRYGHLHRAEIGANLQTLTPDLARGLGLAQDWGVLVSDLLPGGPADRAGLEAKDIIVSIDDKPIDSLPMIAFYLYTRNTGDRLRVAVLRGEQQVTRDVVVVERPEALDRVADLLDPDKSLVRQLGILGVSIDEELRSVIGNLRLPSGVLVAARAEDSRASAAALSPGDVVHSVNGVSISNLEELRAALDGLQPKTSVALQIEREGLLTFVAFALD